MRYSDLRQINRSNVTQLRPVWIFHTGDLSDKTKWPSAAHSRLPVVVNGVMYVTTPFSRLIALDPETGRELWSFDPRIDRNQSATYYHRGVRLDGRTKSSFASRDPRRPAVPIIAEPASRISVSG